MVCVFNLSAYHCRSWTIWLVSLLLILSQELHACSLSPFFLFSEYINPNLIFAFMFCSLIIFEYLVNWVTQTCFLFLQDLSIYEYFFFLRFSDYRVILFISNVGLNSTCFAFSLSLRWMSSFATDIWHLWAVSTARGVSSFCILTSW